MLRPIEAGLGRRKSGSSLEGKCEGMAGASFGGGGGGGLEHRGRCPWLHHIPSPVPAGVLLGDGKLSRGDSELYFFAGWSFSKSSQTGCQRDEFGTEEILR